MKKIYIGNDPHRPELVEVESTGKTIDEYWEQTDRGPLSKASLFPVSRRADLEAWAERVNAAREALTNAFAGIYKISRD